MKKAISALLDLLKGFILGFVCLATPGLSAGTIAVIIGAFNKIIEEGNNLLHNIFSKKWWKTVLYFLVLGVGVIIGTLVGSKIVGITFDKYPIGITICLIGFVIGSLPMLFNNIKDGIKDKYNYIIFFVVIILVVLYTFLLSSSKSVTFDNMNVGKYLLLALMGAITVATMIIPGISGNIFLMAFGYYYPLVQIINNIKDNPISYSLKVIIPFLIGCIIGAIAVVKLIKVLLDKWQMKTNVAIFAFVVTTPIVMVKLNIINILNQQGGYDLTSKELIFGIIAAIIALILSLFIGFISIKKANNKKIDINQKDYKETN